MATIQKITPCLWFDNEAEEAAKFYTSVFSAGPGGKNSEIGRIGRYNKEGYEFHHRPAGSILTIEFTLDGQSFLALNGGPVFKFTEAVSLIVYCDTQEEIDYYWEKLSEGGDDEAKQCGWLKDKYGLSWQITPKILTGMFLDAESERSERVMKAMMQMKKLDIAELERAFSGEEEPEPAVN
jgi:predicted 3-demethylubiquinone-9 3-methyltransferase (glyoxalase superfamily)